MTDTPITDAQGQAFLDLIKQAHEMILRAGEKIGLGPCSASQALVRASVADMVRNGHAGCAVRLCVELLAIAGVATTEADGSDEKTFVFDLGPTPNTRKH